MSEDTPKPMGHFLHVDPQRLDCGTPQHIPCSKAGETERDARVEWSSEYHLRLRACETALRELLPFAIAYGDHPKRNLQDSLERVVAAEKALSK